MCYHLLNTVGQCVLSLVEILVIFIKDMPFDQGSNLKPGCVP